MSCRSQLQTTLELKPNSKAFGDRRNEQPEYITVYGYVADALVKLMEAGRFGVHIDELRRDALARFDQNRIPFECFENRKRGTGGDAAWVRLDFPNYLDAKLVAVPVR